MQQQIISLFERKLADALRVAEGFLLEEHSKLTKGIGPAPTCPFVGDVMRQKQVLFARGHAARDAAARKLLEETLETYADYLSRSLTNELQRVVEKHFPRDHYVQATRYLPGTYARAMAPTNKFSQRIFDHELSLIEVGSANASIQTVSRLATICEEALLKLQLAPKSSSTQTEKLVSQINFHGPVSGHIVVAGETINNTTLKLSLAEIIAKIDASSAAQPEKEEAKSRLKDFLAHPLVSAVVGGLAGGAVG